MPFVHHTHSVFRLMSNTNTSNKKKRVSSRTEKRGGNVSLVEKTDTDIELTDDEPVLFDIYNYSGELVKSIRGTTNENIEKSKVVNTNVKYGFYILCEERNKINKIEKKYRKIWEKGIKELREKKISEVRKETNWKLRVLNEREKEHEKMLKDAELLLEFSKKALKEAKKEEKKEEKKNKNISNKEPTRRSSRIAEKRISKCMGCIENQPNQMAHMGLNGCLGEEI